MGFQTCWVVERPIDGKFVRVAGGSEKVGYDIVHLFQVPPIDPILKDTYRKGGVPDTTEDLLALKDGDLRFIVGPWVLDWAQAMWLMTTPPVAGFQDLIDDILKMVEGKNDRLIIWGDP